MKYTLSCFPARDIWRNGIFAIGGLLFAPGGIEQDGYLFKLVLSGGLYRYNTANFGLGELIGAQFYLGPEFAFIGAEGYHHIRLGARMTDLRSTITNGRLPAA